LKQQICEWPFASLVVIALMCGRSYQDYEMHALPGLVSFARIRMIELTMSHWWVQDMAFESFSKEYQTITENKLTRSCPSKSEKGAKSLQPFFSVFGNIQDVITY
jgi:hypothetical protein